MLTPLGHSPHFDLVAEVRGRIFRIQVKTSTFRRESHGCRWQVQLATLGGNRSWGGVAKRFDESRVDYLFVLAGDGRRWLIPACGPRGAYSRNRRGPKYSEYEISSGSAIESAVYGEPENAARIAARARGSVEAGESSEPVKFVPMAEWVRIPPPPSNPPRHLHRPESRAALALGGDSVIGAKRRTGIPLTVFNEAGLSNR